MEDLLAHGSLRTKVNCQSGNLDGIQGKVSARTTRRSGKGEKTYWLMGACRHGLSVLLAELSAVSKAASTVSRPIDRQQ